MSCLVTALFYEWDDMEGAIDALVARGIEAGDLSLMLNGAAARKYLDSERTAAGRGSDEPSATLAQLAANLVMAAAGSTSILATGPMMTALAARGANAFIGGIAAGLCGLGISEHEAAYYEYKIRTCDALLLGVTTAKHHPDGLKAFLERFDTAGARRSLAVTA